MEQGKTLEEGIYWKHFTDIHFLLTLPPDFQDHLVLPEKFSSHMKALFSDEVSLKGPSGASWDIELLKSDKLTFRGSGWKEFVEVHGLRENYLLLFKYERNKMFEVLIFDQGSCCEKESAYFVRKYQHTESDLEDREEMVMGDASTEILDYDGEEESSIAVSKRLSKDGAAGFCSEEKNTPSLGSLCADENQRGTPRKRKRSISNETSKEVSHSSRREMITPENGENITENNHSCESKSRSKKTVNGGETTIGIGYNSRELINPENGENSQTLSEKQPRGDDRENEHIHVSRNNVIILEDEDSWNEKDTGKKVAQNGKISLKGQFEKQPRGDDMENEDIHVSQSNVIILEDENSLNEKDTAKEVAQNSRELIAPKYGKKSLKGHFGMEYIKRRTGKKVTRISYRKVNRPTYRESSVEEDDSSISHRKRDGPKPESVSYKYSMEYMSIRRPVTDLEKQSTLQRAYENQTEDSFMVLMKSTNVYRRFYLSIPTEWFRKHCLQQKQEVVLRVGRKTWHLTLVTHWNNFKGFKTGWKRFAIENYLEEFDVLVFKPVNQNIGVMDVDIFRVVATINPPLPKKTSCLRRH